MPVSIQHVAVRGGSICRVRGALDETLDPDQIAGEYQIVVFDFEGVQRVTSFGVRQWVTGLKRLKADYYCFINCHPAIVSQFNTVARFGMNGELVSLYAPYVCNDCEKACEFLIDLRSEQRQLDHNVVPDRACPHCGGVACFDDAPDVYFAYAATARRPWPPPPANAMIDGRATDGRSDLSVKKHVEGTVTGLWLSGFADKSAHFRRLAEGLEGQVVVVMQDADGFNGDGLTGFRRFLESVEGDVYLARVPARIVETLCDALDGARNNVHVASLRVPFQCTDCQRVATVELDANSLRDETQPRTIICPSCSSPIDIQLPATIAGAARRLRFEAAPPSVRAYLRVSSAEIEAPFNPTGPTMAGSSDLVLGKYRIVRSLGRGGMGEVLLARQIGPSNFEKLVVLKRMRRDQVQPQAEEMFLREARLAARLSHPNIAQILDFAKTPEGYYMVMEWVNGIDLSKALRLSLEQGRFWPIEMAIRVISEVCSALHAAHSHVQEDGRPNPVIHRDVSPANVLLSSEGAVKLADFGIAKAMRDPGITEVGVYMGKAAYSAPEQLRPQGQQIDRRVDVFAAGVVLYEMLTLRRYGEHEDVDQPAPAPAIRRFRPDVPEELENAYFKAVAADREERFPTARAFQIELERRVQRTATMVELGEWVQTLTASSDEMIGVG